MQLSHMKDRALSGDTAYFKHLSWVTWYQLDFSGSEGEGNGHAGSGGPDLSKVLEEIGISPGSSIIDLGSGKGAACFTLLNHPFVAVKGVELSPRLHLIACRNAQKLGLDPRLTLEHDDATAVNLDGFSHVYLFNPFPDAIVSRVFANVRKSHFDKPRPLTIIYKYPGIPNIEPFGYRSRKVFSLPLSHPFYVYTL
jgi:hypothetical protein